ncbi:hypothetical protein CRG98_018484 [Punica granatum]|uniref:Uncharacterized protein n=1 Tax=Punica granatum TaxID=22663 RepID=A0A2I0JXV6_PUNGR|nr:hypothetical protein CRG98_018484 [Punica granatum]
MTDTSRGLLGVGSHQPCSKIPSGATVEKSDPKLAQSVCPVTDSASTSFDGSTAVTDSPPSDITFVDGSTPPTVYGLLTRCESQQRDSPESPRCVNFLILIDF